MGRRSGTLVLRNLSSDPGFARSLQKVGLDDVDVLSTKNLPQKRVLGDYQPVGTYTSKNVFEKRGCL